MFGIIGESESDVETLAELVRRIKGMANLSVRKKGYNGCAEMLVKSAKHLVALRDLGCDKFVICYDSDGSLQEARKQTIFEKIIKPSGIFGEFCALVPVQEIESWILADLSAITKVISSFRPGKQIVSPEMIASPKEYLENLSRKKARPLYSHAIHNQKVAKHLDINIIYEKCPSFRPLFTLVNDGRGNVKV